jgi:hypothetical protein
MHPHIGGRKNLCHNCSQVSQTAPPSHCVFYNADGSLTRYSFLCGYVEVRKDMTLGMEHGVYHVKGFHMDKRIWESFDSLTEARAYFRRFPKS